MAKASVTSSLPVRSQICCPHAALLGPSCQQEMLPWSIKDLGHPQSVVAAPLKVTLVCYVVMQRSVFFLAEPFRDLSRLEGGESCEVFCVYLMLQDNSNVSVSVLINSVSVWYCTAFGSLAFVDLCKGTHSPGRQLAV